MLLYRLVRAVLRAAMNVFFREIHLVGQEFVPAEGDGPVIFTGNHPNSLIDPVLVVATAGRIVHFAASDAQRHALRQPFWVALNVTI